MRADSWDQYQVVQGSFTFREQTRPVDTTVFLDDLVSDEKRAVQVHTTLLRTWAAISACPSQ